MKNFFSIKNVFSVRNLTIMALLAALDVVLARYTTIHLTPQFTLVSFEYIPAAVVSALFGPWAGIVFGLVSDTVGYFSNPVGPYLPIWAISAMVANLIQSIFLYPGKFDWWRIIVARLLVMLIVTMGLNFIWQSIYFGAAATVYYNSARIISNIIQLPIQVILIRIFGKIAMRTVQRLNANRQSI
ncbi:folate family ECF transporter S component [Pediococcus pentosaceus]|uniref:folate family ECF transporter S component n=1 Tax=Pediococcus pentosaceus TaxID=1255 RepID=UPI001F40B6DE|nr:folate family ECF transporter S component [Pediococcus pentosaceus]MCE5959900.1 folate family ECF transporter S component [Pediococcus pentosaceus]